MGGGEGGLQLGLLVRLTLGVVGGDGEVEGGLHLRDQQVRAGARVGRPRLRRLAGGGRLDHHPAAVAGHAGADAGRVGRRQAHGQRPAHAVADRAGLLPFVRHLLGVEEGEPGQSVTGGVLRVQRLGQLAELGPVGRIAEVERLGQHRRLAGAVERVWHDDRVAARRQPPAHVAERGPEAQGVGEHHHRRPLARGRGVVERRVGLAVGGLDHHVGLGDVGGGEGGRGGARQGDACGRGAGELAPGGAVENVGHDVLPF